MLELNSHSIEQRAILQFGSQVPHFNEVKEIIYDIGQAAKNISLVLEERAHEHFSSIINKVVNSSYLISLHLLKVLQEKSSSVPTRNSKVSNKIGKPVSESEGEGKKLNKSCQLQCEQKQKQESIPPTHKNSHFKNKLGGVFLYNQSYIRKIDQEIIKNEKNKKEKTSNPAIPPPHFNFKQFKKEIFAKMERQLKAAEEDIYHPIEDELSSFLVFQRKFIENFNHYSKADQIQQILNLFHRSTLEAADFLKRMKLNEEVSKFQAEMYRALEQLQNQKNKREKGIEERFSLMLEMFVKKREQFNKDVKQKIKQLEVDRIARNSQRISVGTETSKLELKAIKIYERRIEELQERLTFFELEKEKKFQQLLQKIDIHKNQLKNKDTDIQRSLAKKDEEINLLKLQLDKMKKRYHSLSLPQHQIITNQREGGSFDIDEKRGGKPSRFGSRFSQSESSHLPLRNQSFENLKKEDKCLNINNETEQIKSIECNSGDGQSQSQLDKIFLQIQKLGQNSTTKSNKDFMNDSQQNLKEETCRAKTMKWIFSKRGLKIKSSSNEGQKENKDDEACSSKSCQSNKKSRIQIDPKIGKQIGRKYNGKKQTLKKLSYRKLKTEADQAKIKMNSNVYGMSIFPYRKPSTSLTIKNSGVTLFQRPGTKNSTEHHQSPVSYRNSQKNFSIKSHKEEIIEILKRMQNHEGPNIEEIEKTKMIKKKNENHHSHVNFLDAQNHSLHKNLNRRSLVEKKSHIEDQNEGPSIFRINQLGKPIESQKKGRAQSLAEKNNLNFRNRLELNPLLKMVRSREKAAESWHGITLKNSGKKYLGQESGEAEKQDKKVVKKTRCKKLMNNRKENEGWKEPKFLPLIQGKSYQNEI